jgi:hypothetical protein
MAALINRQFYVGPDNGLFSLLIEEGQSLSTPPVYIALNKPCFWLSKISQSFHGRDIFAPVAAHLANGVTLEKLGDPFDDPVRLPFPKPQKTSKGWQGQVMRVDHFGNLITNFSALQLPQDSGVNLHVRNTIIKDYVTTFGSRPEDTLITMIDSSGYLAIAVVNGSAAEKLGVEADEPVLLTLSSEAHP